ncbi:gliding motility-associated-like protein [Lacibacter cauensis]|uniref:Gliding motility-associated-like protein n=1 Tax=Lacibacter cauensis TaxID=510947 RepID=A0A562SEA0_9BACT|nr:gliding motility-associated C-terminal domain-containing protein [Lacibacter cauensis]TWI79070.1 gliding motility-associated-like protein [Lacibacter cauensis]
MNNKQHLSQFFLLTIFLFCFCAGFTGKLQAQCTTLGQTPATAFPVCGTGVFLQNNVPSCQNNEIIVPGCNPNQNRYYDVNPFWYKFTCFTSGSLGFLIDPINTSDDYDWQIWDVTGIDPNTVYSNTGRVVAANWSGLTGQTGTASNASSLIECGSYGGNNPPKYSRLPNIVAGKTYLLMISNFSNSQKGYKLSFGGGTAVITDPKEPLMQQVRTNCAANELRLKLNKKMKCSSIAANGSDVVAFPGNITATNMRPIGCNSSFETDSVVITLSQPLPPGNYALQLKNGSDGNTILDVCDRSIPTTNTVPFTVIALQPTAFDSIAPVSCAPNSVRFVFKKLIRCSSIDASGSDFSITGTYPVTITGARGNCNADGLTGDIIVTFAQPLQQAGNFTIALRSGFDGNTIVDECSQATPPSQLSFSVLDTVNASFTYNIAYGCQADTVLYTHPGGNGINSWQWNFAASGSGNQQQEQIIYNSFGTKKATLIVSNGFCSDTSAQDVRLNNFLQAEFDVNRFICPDSLLLVNPAPVTERPLQFLWQFGDGTTSTDSLPLPHLYPSNTNEVKYTVTYTITNDLGCSSSISKEVIQLRTCRIDVPTAFTPNGDGLNDFFGPLNALAVENLQFRIYNRWGGLVFETNDWTKPWDGKVNGVAQPAANYVWTLTYKDLVTGKDVSRKGSFILIR